MPDNVSERIKRWKNKLIDLTKRNRLLNFKPTKVTTIRIVDELPPEILNILALQKEGMEFLPIEAPETNDGLFENQNEISPSESDISVEFEEHRKEDLEEKHGDMFLQTTLAKEILSKNLFRIYSKANSVMEFFFDFFSKERRSCVGFPASGLTFAPSILPYTRNNSPISPFWQVLNSPGVVA